MAFGGFGGFGTTTTSTASGGGLFGPTTTPSFSGFGAAATTKSVTFGQPATSTTGFGGFGTQPGGFSFGTPASTAAPTFGGFGTPASSAAPTFGGFGQPASTAAPTFGGFGQPAATSTGFSFGTPSFGGFGATTSAGGTSFSFGKPFGTTTTASGGFLGFGAGQQQQQQQQQQQAQQQQQTAAMYCAMLNVTIFGDERDAILTKWNQLQAKWGVGKGFYSAEAAPVDFSSDNPYCLMKAVGYARLPTAKNDGGVVVLRLNKKEADVRAAQQQTVDALSAALGSRPQLTVCVDTVRPLTGDQTEMHIYVQERAANGAVRRVPASDLHAHLSAPAQRTALTSLGVEQLVPLVAPSSEQLNTYLETPPAGIDKLIWEQAKKDNPQPDQLVPVPMVGFHELHRRIQCQQQETGCQQRRLDLIASDISELQRTQASTAARLAQLKRTHLELAHRILRLLVRQEVLRKQGWSIQPEEENLRVKLEALHDDLAKPTQFKGRLNELLSQTRLQSQQLQQRAAGYSLLPGGEQHILQLLKTEQAGIQQLVNVMQADLADLEIIRRGLEAGPRR